MELNSYEGFPWMKPARPSAEWGITGPVYEIRTYGIQPGGVQPTIDLCQQYLPARHERSPCVVAMVARRAVALHEHLGLPDARRALEGARRCGGRRHLAAQGRAGVADDGDDVDDRTADGCLADEVTCIPSLSDDNRRRGDRMVRIRHA